MNIVENAKEQEAGKQPLLVPNHPDHSKIHFQI